MTANASSTSEICFVEDGRLMEDGRLDEMDALGMSFPDLASPEDPCRTPVVGDEGDRT